jgi:ABC-type sugar transport system ATPase subunit
MRRRGNAVVYVSHRVDEVLELADRVIALRDGRLAGVETAETVTAGRLVDLIVGRGLIALSPRKAPPTLDSAVFSAWQLSGTRLDGIDLEIEAGEIVGIAGLVGCGRSELARIIAGAQRPSSGRCAIAGTEYAAGDPVAGLKAGVAYVPQDRHGQGCIGGMSLQENLTIGMVADFSRRGWLSLRREKAEAMRMMSEFEIVPPRPARLMSQFSGGNQQKALLARALRHHPRLLVLDEPMQGIDIGAKRAIKELLIRLADQGLAIIVASTDNEDFADLCQRVIILDRGRQSAVLHGADVTKDNITRLCSLTGEHVLNAYADGAETRSAP